MNRYARGGPNWVEITQEPMVCNAIGIAVSWETLESWSPQECLEFGLGRIESGDQTPPGSYEVSRSLGDVDGVPTWKGVFAEYEVVVPAEPTPAPEVIPNISDRQFGSGLWIEKIITFDECSDFVSSGVIPAALQAIVDTLPDDETGEPTPRKEAIIFIKGAKEYIFNHPLVDVVRQAEGWTVEYLKERWITWATL